MLQTLPALDAPDLLSYDKILVAFSGGKDCTAALLLLLELGVPPSMIELHHHDVDGGWAFMDWPVTRSYCKAFALEFGIDIIFSWREGGFLREMERDGTPTAPVIVERPDGTRITAGGKGPPGTRGMFPQVSANLSVRWCSAYLKIDVMDMVIRNDPTYKGLKLLVVTGERAEESTSRARYARFEPHRTDLRNSKGGRHVDHWRPVHHMVRAEVWDTIRRHGVVAHPGYFIGYGRLSCKDCIFASKDQWATSAEIDPRGFDRIARKERATGKTIHRTRSVSDQSLRGMPYRAAMENPHIVEMALNHHFSGPIWVPASEWTMPAGATGEDVGPT